MNPQELLRLHTFFGVLTEQETRELLRPSTVKRVQKRNVVFRRGDPGDGLYGVLAGRILITIDSIDGKELILNSHGQGEFFGEIALLDQVGRSASAVAGETSELLFLGRDVFRAFLAQRPEAMNRIISVLCARLRRSTDVIEDAAFLNVASRLAKQVISLIQESDRAGTREQQPTVHVSQADLARMLGVSREFVNKQLKVWRAAGIVELGRRTMVVRDRRALEQLVGGGRTIAGTREGRNCLRLV
ncbi:Crp/Fnr family transcriptional regulator [Reyranella sp.]|uniref:Crp/Fnr family transcriptional regulator n=1 Tax=Reyranella sp. TaxID=1929291 RepID=UPI003D103634